MEIHRKAQLVLAGVALLVAIPAGAGEKVQIKGSTSIELPKPKHILEDGKTVRRYDGPSGRSEYEGGSMPGGVMLNNSPQSDKKLKEAIDKKKNWIFINPYEMQFDSKTEEFLQGEKGTGLYNHRLMKDDEKGVVERFIKEKNPERENETSGTEGSKDPETGGKLEPVGKRELDPSAEPEATLLLTPERGISLDSSIAEKTALVGERSAFQQKLERSPFSESFFGERTAERSGIDREDFRKEREARDAELSKIYEPRVTGQSFSGGINPLNSGVDLTRQEANPFAPRAEQFGGGRPAVGAISGGRNSPIFTGPSVGGGLGTGIPERSGFSDFGSKGAPVSSFAPNAMSPAPSAKPSFSAAPFVLPRPQRKF